MHHGGETKTKNQNQNNTKKTPSYENTTKYEKLYVEFCRVCSHSSRVLHKTQLQAHHTPFSLHSLPLLRFTSETEPSKNRYKIKSSKIFF